MGQLPVWRSNSKTGSIIVEDLIVVVRIHSHHREIQGNDWESETSSLANHASSNNRGAPGANKPQRSESQPLQKLLENDFHSVQGSHKNPADHMPRLKFSPVCNPRFSTSQKNRAPHNSETKTLRWRLAWIWSFPKTFCAPLEHLPVVMAILSGAIVLWLALVQAHPNHSIHERASSSKSAVFYHRVQKALYEPTFLPSVQSNYSRFRIRPSSHS